MKIAFLHMTAGLTRRGSEISTDLLASELAKSHEVLMIQAGEITKKPYKVIRVMPLKNAPLSGPRHLLDKVRRHLELDEESLAVRVFTTLSVKHLQNFDPDIIVATNGAPQIKILKRSKLKAKIVAFGRAGIGAHDKRSLRARPDLFVALSEPARAWAEDQVRYNLRKPRIIYVPNPMNPRFLQRKASAKIKLNSPIVLTVSALSSYKHVDQVIRSVDQTTASLLLIGDGEMRDQVSAQLSHLENSFQWIKHVDPSELAGYYKAADVFCFIPGPQESFGRVYLEAMGAGLPIVATDDLIRRAICGPQAIYVNPSDQRAVAEGILQALLLGKINYRAQLKPYMIDTVINQIEEAFHDII